jgi:hypothetical protein
MRKPGPRPGFSSSDLIIGVALELVVHAYLVSFYIFTENWGLTVDFAQENGVRNR